MRAVTVLFAARDFNHWQVKVKRCVVMISVWPDRVRQPYGPDPYR